MYRATFSWPRHQLGVSGQLRAQAASPLRKESLHPLDRRLGGSHSWSGRHREVKILDPTGTRGSELRPLGSLAIPTALSRNIYIIQIPITKTIKPKREAWVIVVFQQRQIPFSEFVYIFGTERLQLTESRDAMCLNCSTDLIWYCGSNTFSCCSNTIPPLHETQREHQIWLKTGGCNHTKRWHTAKYNLHKLLSEIFLDKIWILFNTTNRINAQCD
jgi:hypothetical protein